MIGTHAVTHRPRILDETDAILAQPRACGSDGIETGMRVFGMERQGRLIHALEKNGMRLSGWLMIEYEGGEYPSERYVRAVKPVRENMVENSCFLQRERGPCVVDGSRMALRDQRKGERV